MTLGFDPAKGRFVGSFIASMMSMMWLYEGSLDAEGKSLVLDTEGPSMTGDGSMAKYQDVITFLSPDHRTLTSRARPGRPVERVRQRSLSPQDVNAAANPFT